MAALRRGLYHQACVWQTPFSSLRKVASFASFTILFQDRESREARDATEIEAREKPVEKDGKDDPPPPAAEPPKRRGRPRKGEERPKPKPSRLERQATQSLAKMLAELPTACDVGCKKNSKGYKETWIGYKLHLDVACGQIPVACVLTSASVHDICGHPVIAVGA